MGRRGAGGLWKVLQGVREWVYKVCGVRNEVCDVRVCRIQQVSHKCLWSDVCVQGRLGCHPVLASLPVRSPEMPKPGCLYPLPFILLAFTKAFVLGFRLNRRWPGGRRATWRSWNLCSFPLSLSHVLGRDWKGRGEDAHVSGSLCLLPPHGSPQRVGVQAQALRPGWYPRWRPLGAVAAGAGLGVRQVCQP